MTTVALCRRIAVAGAAAALALAAPAGAQEAGVAAPCSRAGVPSGARDVCHSVAQAVASAQPQLGLLLAGGNPTLGSVSSAGLRLPGSPGLSVSGRVNLVPIRLPDLLDREALAAGEGVSGERTIAAPALAVTASVNLSRGTDLAPTIGGIGSVDLLGSASWVPLRALDVSSFRLESDEFAYGVGARIGVLRESFTLPGASVSVMYRHFNEVGFGSICPVPVTASAGTDEGYRFSSGTCPTSGDPGEFALDLTNWSGRGVIGKQLGRVGIAAGVGFDRFESDVGLGFRAPAGGVAGAAGYIARASDLDVVSDRWSAFANASFTTLVTTFALEAGWMQGGEPLAGFSGGEFDPRGGTLFGSFGVRLSL
jgi:hypothetical protein